jgi:hypothetical protein
LRGSAQPMTPKRAFRPFLKNESRSGKKSNRIKKKRRNGPKVGVQWLKFDQTNSWAWLEFHRTNEIQSMVRISEIISSNRFGNSL